MEEIISKRLQEWLISIAFMIAIPGAVHFGCNLISPKIDNNEYFEQYSKFLTPAKGGMENAQARAALDSEWKKTSMYKERQEKLCKRDGIRLLFSGLLSVGLFFLGSLCTLPIVAAGLLSAANILVAMYSFAPFQCSDVFNIAFTWIELFFVTIGFLVVLLYAYYYSESANHK